MGDFSKDYKVKMKIEDLKKETGMTEKQIIDSILNDYKEPEKYPAEYLNEFIKKGAAKSTVSMEDIFPKK